MKHQAAPDIESERSYLVILGSICTAISVVFTATLIIPMVIIGLVGLAAGVAIVSIGWFGRDGWVLALSVVLSPSSWAIWRP